MKRPIQVVPELANFFSDHRALQVSTPSPIAPAARKDISSCVHVSIEHETATLAFMDANTQRLQDRLGASATLLTRTVWIHCNNFTPSFFRFGANPVQDYAPSGISYFFT